jgi:uncharacterized protein YndB with AHSA1/START domain
MTEGEPSGDRLVVRRTIGASRERVFQSWTDPEQLRRWWGPGGFTCPDAVVDLRPGGTYRLVMQPPADGPVMSVSGTYREVEPPTLLVYTWRWDSGPAVSDQESLVRVEFTDVGDGRTEVTITHDQFPPGHDTLPYSSGWEQGMDKLSALVERGDIDA